MFGERDAHEEELRRLHERAVVEPQEILGPQRVDAHEPELRVALRVNLRVELPLHRALREFRQHAPVAAETQHRLLEGAAGVRMGRARCELRGGLLGGQGEHPGESTSVVHDVLSILGS